MRSIIRAVTFDCADPYALAEFWAGALGAAIAPGSRPGDPEVSVDTPDGQPRLLFQRVPENKVAKNRVHLDLTGAGTDRDREVERLVGLGATFVSDLRGADGKGGVVLADPEGNEFCVVSG
ncbi:VOC family protein [Thermobifida alba]|uniref:VOC family protein n=1 Tax=Thermobifida alba TaxID=53522 RepID=A0ABY4KYK6_THEAE|nr:VOC family protein [Thermobifida alba]UPT20184.1 VOC family protein [Thermobifida alba]